MKWTEWILELKRILAVFNINLTEVVILKKKTSEDDLDTN